MSTPGQQTTLSPYTLRPGEDTRGIPDGTYNFWPTIDLPPQPAPEAPGSIIRIAPVRSKASGYMVSITNNNSEITYDTLKALHHMPQTPWLGVWTSPDGQRFVDLSVCIANQEDAERIARFFKQQAIWDIASDCEIFITNEENQQP